MNIWLSDEFDGTGDLSDHTPNIGQPDRRWQSASVLGGATGMILSSGGAVGAAGLTTAAYSTISGVAPPVMPGTDPPGIDMTIIATLNSAAAAPSEIFFEIRGGTTPAGFFGRSVLSARYSVSTTALDFTANGALVSSLVSFPLNTAISFRIVSNPTMSELYVNGALQLIRSGAPNQYSQYVRIDLRGAHTLHSIVVNEEAPYPGVLNPALVPKWTDYINTYEVA